jgi:hypothetical protein
MTSGQPATGHCIHLGGASPGVVPMHAARSSDDSSVHRSLCLLSSLHNSNPWLFCSTRHSVEQNDGTLHQHRHALPGRSTSIPTGNRIVRGASKREASAREAIRASVRSPGSWLGTSLELGLGGQAGKRWDFWNLIIPQENSSTLHVSDPTVPIELPKPCRPRARSHPA